MKKPQKKQGKDTRIIPLRDRVLVDPEEKKENDGHQKNAFGIYIPESASKEEKREIGKVIAVGEGAYDHGKLIPVRVKVGDKVIYSKYGYDEIKLDDKKYLIIKEENILAVVK